MVRFAAIVLTGLLLFFLPAVAAADGSSSCTFSGSISLDNTQVSDGTLITAVIEGVEYHTHTSTGYGYSTYSLTIRAPDGKNYADGTKVTFKVNGHPTGQTAIFKAGANVRLDLTASTTSTLSSSRVAIIAVLLLALMAAGAAAYYFLLRRRGLRIGDWLAGKGGVPAAQAPLLVAQGPGQPIQRYIWDNARLAWVENVEQAKSKPPMKRLVTSRARVDAFVGSGVGVAKRMGQSTSVAVKDAGTDIVGKQAMPAVGKTAAEKRESPVLYSGPVDLVVPPPLAVDSALKLSAHLRNLKRTRQIKVLKLEGSAGHGLRVRLLLHSPIPLIRILEALPEIDLVIDWLERPRGIFLTPYMIDETDTRRIVVKLKA